MNADTEFTAETQRRGATLAHAEVVDEIGVFAVVGVASENIRHDLTHAGGNLFARPSGWRGAREVGLVSHDPAGEFANGWGLKVQLRALCPGQLRGDPSG